MSPSPSSRPDAAVTADASAGTDAVDVAVVGAGPAGAAAAITLARAGMRVALLDRATFPREKCCGDGLTTGALRELEALGLRPDAVASWQPVHDVVLRSPSGRETTFPLPRDGGLHAVVAERRDLDAALVDLAAAAGAAVRTGVRVDRVRPAGAGVALTLDAGPEVRAAYAVAADGMWSPVRRSLGLAVAGYLGEWHAFRQYFTSVGPRAATELMVWFEPDLLPGYAWSFPLPGGRANVGFGILRGIGVPTSAMASLWPALLARPHVASFLGPDARPEGPHRAWPIPARLGRLPLVGAGGRVLFAGDAAGATDPMTGEGIGQALLTGRLAAEAVLDAGPTRPLHAAATYRRRVGRELAADHRLARWLATVLRSPLGARGAVRAAGATPWTRREFGRWLFEAYPRALVATPGRWRTHSPRRPGAFPAGTRSGGGSPEVGAKPGARSGRSR